MNGFEETIFEIGKFSFIYADSVTVSDRITNC